MNVSVCSCAWVAARVYAPVCVCTSVTDCVHVRVHPVPPESEKCIASSLPCPLALTMDVATANPSRGCVRPLLREKVSSPQALGDPHCGASSCFELPAQPLRGARRWKLCWANP
ncbi:unnamed protein product [Gulo gulo]|uniref:Uncharacterized protein n=1 Tax=Gulo gulo TaxID=48420 RepID=A0A9X9LYR1_GULGU|nr:unnamed protein product [Gulo gulo]